MKLSQLIALGYNQQGIYHLDGFQGFQSPIKS